tara:strand:- start:1129 stop:1245 length:117 start_codon:yes stop_codon:yes gene_type:complete
MHKSKHKLQKGLKREEQHKDLLGKVLPNTDSEKKNQKM